MLEHDPSADTAPAGEPTLNSSEQATDSGLSLTPARTHLFAAILSALIPGSGHLWLGRYGKGYFLLTAFVTLIVIFWPLRLIRFFWCLIAVLFSWVVLVVYSSCSAQLGLYLPPKRQPKKWLVAVVLPLSILVALQTFNGALRIAGFRIFKVPSTSMAATIDQGDRIVVDMKRHANPAAARREVVLFSKDKTYFVKRVIAVGGDSIQGLPELFF